MSIDWVSTGSMLQGLGSIGGAVAVLFAAWKGAQTYENWKNQKIAERRQDQAERILAAAHRVKDGLSFLRSGKILGHELDSAKSKLMAEPEQWNRQSPQRQKRLVKAQAYFDRLNELIPVRNDLYACMPMARAHFGEEIEHALSELYGQFWRVEFDVRSYIDDNGQDADFTQKLRIGFGEERAPDGQEDVIGDAIKKHFSKIEGICLPALKLEGKT